jgi:hypothetical protein
MRVGRYMLRWVPLPIERHSCLSAKSVPQATTQNS